MAVRTGGQRSGSTYKVSTDTAVTNTMIVDVTGGSGTFYGCECVAGSGTIMLRFYDDTSAVAGTTVPLFSFLVPGSSVFSVNVPQGIPFTAGLSFNATQTDSDPATTTAPAATSTIYIYTT
jgi:hypothetical protein